MERYGLTLSDLIEAIKSNNASAGGSMLTRGSMSLVIRSAGALESIRQIENIFVKSVGGTPDLSQGRGHGRAGRDDAVEHL